uniref:cDNA FLJ26173 fis, clone ADG03859 n=1 Tax=Homo sapiens TaxID=9606 RepID=Q6ZPA3_HUMAN|nr:unnamed protein product [Homo sapiens]
MLNGIFPQTSCLGWPGQAAHPGFWAPRVCKDIDKWHLSEPEALWFGEGGSPGGCRWWGLALPRQEQSCWRGGGGRSLLRTALSYRPPLDDGTAGTTRTPVLAPRVGRLLGRQAAFPPPGVRSPARGPDPGHKCSHWEAGL